MNTSAAQRILIGGHRGLGATDSEDARSQYRDHASLPPENTLESLLGALAAGADFIEFDVVPAKDGLVVCHSARLAEHVFPPPANAIYTAQLTVAELQHLTVGHRGAPQDRMPTLQSLLAAIKKYLTGNKFLNLEIKGLQGTDQLFSDAAQKGFITAILQEVHNAGLMARTLFSSFRAGDLRVLHGIHPGAKIAQLFEPADEPGCLTFTADNVETVLRTMPGITLHPPLSRYQGAPPLIPPGTDVNIWIDQALPLADILHLCRQAASQLPQVERLGFITDYPVELKDFFNVAK